MKRLRMLCLFAVLFTITACQSGGDETHVYIPSKDLTPAVGEEAPDDIMPGPGGPVYWANFHQQGVENPWLPIETTDVALGSGLNEAHITYRNNIGTKAGETRNNIFYVITPNKNVNSLSLYGIDIPLGISLTEGMQCQVPGSMASVLVIEISQDVPPGQYTFEIGLEINGKDYGTVPCMIKVVE